MLQGKNTISYTTKKEVSTADEQFYKDTEWTGILGSVARRAIKAKHLFGLYSAFRGDTTDTGVDGYSLTDTDQIMADSSDASNQNSDGWQGRNMVGYLPMGSGNHARTYIFQCSFKNIVNTTDMNKVMDTFTHYKSGEEGCKIQGISHGQNHNWKTTLFRTSCICRLHYWNGNKRCWMHRTELLNAVSW